MSLAGVVNRLEQAPVLEYENRQNFLLLDGGLKDNLLDELMNLHFPAARRWVLEDTLLDEEKESGTLLQEMDSENTFLQQYIDQWSKEHLGLIIETTVDINTLQQHLKNTIEADTTKTKELFFRWHEPRKLAGLLNTFDNTQHQQLLGPTCKLYWCEYAHDEAHWYAFENLNAKQSTGQGRIMIRQDQLDQMSEYDLYYYARCLARELIAEEKRPEEISEEHFARAVLNNIKKALAINITHSDDLNRYIRIQLEHSNTIAEHKEIRAMFTDETLPTWQRLDKIQQELEKIGKPS